MRAFERSARRTGKPATASRRRARRRGGRRSAPRRISSAGSPPGRVEVRERRCARDAASRCRCSWSRFAGSEKAGSVGDREAGAALAVVVEDVEPALGRGDHDLDAAVAVDVVGGGGADHRLVRHRHLAARIGRRRVHRQRIGVGREAGQLGARRAASTWTRAVAAGRRRCRGRRRGRRRRAPASSRPSAPRSSARSAASDRCGSRRVRRSSPSVPEPSTTAGAASRCARRGSLDRLAPDRSRRPRPSRPGSSSRACALDELRHAEPDPEQREGRGWTPQPTSSVHWKSPPARSAARRADDRTLGVRTGSTLSNQRRLPERSASGGIVVVRGRAASATSGGRSP